MSARSFTVALRTRAARLLSNLLLTSLFLANQGHLNSPDIFLEEEIGPYRALVVTHMPAAVPGEAQVQVRFENRASDDAVTVEVREIPPQGEDKAPEWVTATRSPIDPEFFAAPIPLMVYGLWHAEVRVRGARGEGTTSFPISARVPAPRSMASTLSFELLALGIVLFASLWRIAMEVGGRVVARAAVIVFGSFLSVIGFTASRLNASYQINSRPPLALTLRTSTPPVAGRPMTVKLLVHNAEGYAPEDLAPDHGKMMHLVVVDEPAAASFFHIHPHMDSPGIFQFAFTPPQDGTYVFFADLLDTSGEGDTLITRLVVGRGHPVGPADYRPPPGDEDDSMDFSPPLNQATVNQQTVAAGTGLTMRRLDGKAAPIIAGQVQRLAFALEGSDGRQLEFIQPYMGMAGHLLLLKTDFQMFAHVHPVGTIGGRMKMPMTPDHMAMMNAMKLPPRTSFPYAFPTPGQYRLWVQMKHDGAVHTGVFDVRAE